MITTTTTTTGIDRAVAGLQRVQAHAAEAQRTVIQPLGVAYHAALMAETPVGRGPASGRRRLYQSYEVRERYSAEGSEYRITNIAPWLGWVLRGRGPVVAAKGKVLRFEILGQVFFRKRVGPAAPNNFPARVRAKMDRQLAAAVQQIAGVIVRVFAGEP